MKWIIWIIVIFAAGYLLMAALPMLGMIFGGGGFDP